MIGPVIADVRRMMDGVLLGSRMDGAVDDGSCERAVKFAAVRRRTSDALRFVAERVDPAR